MVSKLLNLIIHNFLHWKWIILIIQYVQPIWIKFELWRITYWSLMLRTICFMVKNPPPTRSKPYAWHIGHFSIIYRSVFSISFTVTFLDGIPTFCLSYTNSKNLDILITSLKSWLSSSDFVIQNMLELGTNAHSLAISLYPFEVLYAWNASLEMTKKASLKWSFIIPSFMSVPLRPKSNQFLNLLISGSLYVSIPIKSCLDPLSHCHYPFSALDPA